MDEGELSLFLHVPVLGHGPPCRGLPAGGQPASQGLLGDHGLTHGPGDGFAAQPDPKR